ncbi:hypothetical protein OG689_36035 [Kitasatospora sp. NBC_00240]|uniref:Zn-ribbon domain-containing OB-fold protein n=1 Tax=Kitasatospora sp. NBC_00240 TaxID=2903567 RepID=UPI00225C0A61|nr:hypothetical protein [Kitasatospora sp. NBC_00240]MCX5214606.1 hypothetical protein [Kitasatospora sp. NBC_00240]
MELAVATPTAPATGAGTALADLPVAEPAFPGAELIHLRCRWCRAATAPTCLLCPVCGSADLLRERGSGAGTVQRLLPAAQRGQHRLTPYVIALDEGFTVRAAVVGALPGAVIAGTRVQLAAVTGAGRVLTFQVSPDQVYGHLRQPAPAAGRHSVRSSYWDL